MNALFYLKEDIPPGNTFAANLMQQDKNFMFLQILVDTATAFGYTEARTTSICFHRRLHFGSLLCARELKRMGFNFVLGVRKNVDREYKDLLIKSLKKHKWRNIFNHRKNFTYCVFNDWKICSFISNFRCGEFSVGEVQVVDFYYQWMNAVDMFDSTLHLSYSIHRNQKWTYCLLSIQLYLLFMMLLRRFIPHFDDQIYWFHSFLISSFTSFSSCSGFSLFLLLFLLSSPLSSLLSLLPIPLFTLFPLLSFYHYSHRPFAPLPLFPLPLSFWSSLFGLVSRPLFSLFVVIWFIMIRVTTIVGAFVSRTTAAFAVLSIDSLRAWVCFGFIFVWN